MGEKPWWYDAVQASRYMPGIAPWQWFDSSDNLRWMLRVIDAAAAERMAEKNRGA